MKKKIIAIVISMAVFGLVLWAVLSGKAGGFDDTIRHAFYSIRCTGLTVLGKGFAAIGSWWGVSIICVVLLIIRKTRLRAGVPVALVAIVGQIVEKTVKYLVKRPRPDIADRLIEQTGYSFPSGHATTSMAVYLMLIYVVRTQIQTPFTKNLLTVILAIPMIGIGLSRIYLGVHYPTDVIAGWSLGIALTVTCIIFVEKSSKKRGDRLQ